MQLKTELKPKSLNVARIKQRVQAESKFILDLFSVISLPTRKDDEDDADEYVYVKETNKHPEVLTKRAKSILELENKLKIAKSKNDFSMKNKLLKRSISKKLKKKERMQEKKRKRKLLKVKKAGEDILIHDVEAKPTIDKVKLVTPVKPVFNNDGKLVFSKFDFSGAGSSNEKRRNKGQKKDPKKILENLKMEEETVKELKESGDVEKAIEKKEKLMWKNVLAKAEGDKIKDDPILLKKSIQKKIHKKNTSKKKWEERTQNVEKTKEKKQKKRQSNITKRKHDKKAKKMKKAMKKGRIIPGV